nr:MULTISPECIES: contractile injection system protein, VgrG/Pvc8 family [unclassified Fusobacterium]
MGPWYPDENARLLVGLLQIDNGVPKFLDLGTFYVDEPTFSPNQLSLKCLALPLDQNIRQQENSSSWEKITLNELVAQLAIKHQLNVEFYADDIYFERLDQDRETDIGFLKRILDENGLNLKIANDSLIIFDDEKQYNNGAEKEVTAVFTMNDYRIRDYTLRKKNRDIYDRVEVSYYDADKKQHIVEVITKEELQERNEVTVQ